MDFLEFIIIIIIILSMWKLTLDYKIFYQNNYKIKVAHCQPKKNLKNTCVLGCMATN